MNSLVDDIKALDYQFEHFLPTKIEKMRHIYLAKNVEHCHLYEYQNANLCILLGI